jgi:hypothetical protein
MRTSFRRGRREKSVVQVDVVARRRIEDTRYETRRRAKRGLLATLHPVFRKQLSLMYCFFIVVVTASMAALDNRTLGEELHEQSPAV